MTTKLNKKTPRKKKWVVTGHFVTSKFLGRVEASTKAEALKLADDLDAYISVCHQLLVVTKWDWWQ